MLYTQESLQVRLQVTRSLLDLTQTSAESNPHFPIPVIGRVIESVPSGPAIDSLVLAPGMHDRECSIPVSACLPLEAGTNEKMALLAGVAAPCLAALRRTNFEIGATGVILGLNLYGLLLVSACRLAGAGNISALDADASRRQMAEKLGAGRVVSPEEPGWPEALVQGSSRGGADVVFATTNQPGLVEAIFPKCRKEARVLLLASIPTNPLELYNAIHSPGRILLGPEPDRSGQQWVTDASRLLRLIPAGRYRPEGIIGELVKASDGLANSMPSHNLTLVLDWEI